jgi:hypothetical protein
MRSSTERFPESQHCKTPFGVYDIDQANKKGISTSVRDSRQLLAASFSKTNRWRSALTSAAPDVVYDTDIGRFQTLESSVNHSPIAYSNIRSKYRRFKPLNAPTDAPDVTYNTDTGIKQTLSTAVEQSPVKYSIMRSSTQRFRGKAVPSSTPLELGPGSYDPVCSLDLRRSQETKPLSSFLSTSARFGVKEDPTKYHGGTYSIEKDAKTWNKTNGSFPKAQVRRPQYLPA